MKYHSSWHTAGNASLRSSLYLSFGTPWGRERSLEAEGRAAQARRATAHAALAAWAVVAASQSRRGALLRRALARLAARRQASALGAWRAATVRRRLRRRALQTALGRYYNLKAVRGWKPARLPGL